MNWHHSRVYLGAQVAGRSLFARSVNAFLRGLNEFRLPLVAIRERPSIIQVKDRFLVALLGLLTARLLKVPFCFWLSYPYHEEDLERARKGTGIRRWFLYARAAYIRKILRILLRSADHVFAQSQKMVGTLVSMGGDSRRLTAVPMGVDVERIQQALEVPAMPDRDCICYLGALSRYRQLDMLIDALAIVRRSQARVRLLLVGSGEIPADEQLLLNRAAALGISDAVTITGQLPQPEAWQHVRGSLIALSPLRASTVWQVSSPTKVAEYLALERPVVVTDVADQAELVDEFGAGEVVAWSAESFAAGILRILERPEDALARASEAGKAVLCRRSYDTLATRVEGVYRGLLR